MKKLISLLLALSLLVVCVPAFAQTASPEITEWAKAEAEKLPADAKEINVFTWTYYIPDEVVDEFMSATGINVNYSALMGDNEEIRTKLSQSPGMYDLVVCSDYIIGSMAEMGLLSEIDSAKLPNYSNIDASYQGQFYDPDNKYTIPYTNTIPLLVYNPDKVPTEVTGYEQLWGEEFLSSLSCVAEPRVIIGMAQKKLGMSYNETDPEKLQLVKDELMKLKPNILSLNSDTPHNALIAGDAKAGFMFGSQIIAARDVLPNLKTVYPKEGLGFGIDSLVIPAQAPHLDATYIFLNYLLDGAVSAYASSLINYGNCNVAAQDFLPEDYKANDTLNVPAELVKSAEMIKPLDAETQKIYDDIWVSFRQ